MTRSLVLAALTALALAAPASAQQPFEPSPIQHVEVNGANLGYRTVGTGPPLVMIMGIVGDDGRVGPGADRRPRHPAQDRALRQPRHHHVAAVARARPDHREDGPAQTRAEGPLWFCRGCGAYGKLPRVRARTLVTDGRLDIVEPPENSRIIARRIPGAKLTLYRGAGHAHLFQFNGRYAGEVNGFLAAP